MCVCRFCSPLSLALSDKWPGMSSIWYGSSYCIYLLLRPSLILNVCVCVCVVLYCQVFCFNPASIESLDLVEYMALFLDNLVPVRFVFYFSPSLSISLSFPSLPQHVPRLGVLLVSEEDSEVGVALSRGFYYIAEHHTARDALRWLLEVYYYTFLFFFSPKFAVWLLWGFT